LQIEQAIRQQLEFQLSEQPDPNVREKIVSTLTRRVQRTLQAMAFESLKQEVTLPVVLPQPEGMLPEEYLREVAKEWLAQLQTSMLQQIVDREFRILELEQELGLNINDPNFYG